MITPNSKTSTLVIAANAVVQNVALPLGGGLKGVIFNRGPSDAYVEFTNDANGIATIPAVGTPGSMLVAFNQPCPEIQLRTSDTRIATISASTSSLFFTRGSALE